MGREGELEGPEIGAFFDLDRTLIAGFSALAFGRDLLRSGQLDLWSLQLEITSTLRPKPRRGEDGPGYGDLISILAGLLVGVRESVLVGIGERLFEAEYRDRLHPEAFELIAQHRARGHTLVIASAATVYQAGPIARAFGIEDVLCTRLETLAGRLTGSVDSACWSEGKLEAARVIARDRGIRLEDSYFYSDGIEDLPLLEVVGHPRPTNADEGLAAVARERGWELTSFEEARPPTLWELARPLIEERRTPDWRERFERAFDQPVRMGYRTAHWMRRSIRSVRDESTRRD